jgi:hypothetical protein
MTPCPSCHTRRKATGKPVCAGCWSSLTLTARRALSKRDTTAMARLRDLHCQVAAGTPLRDIEVTP